jgi:hypothetical protein
VGRDTADAVLTAEHAGGYGRVHVAAVQGRLAPSAARTVKVGVCREERTAGPLAIRVLQREKLCRSLGWDVRS